jgi:hypothetical protein
MQSCGEAIKNGNDGVPVGWVCSSQPSLFSVQRQERLLRLGFPGTREAYPEGSPLRYAANVLVFLAMSMHVGIGLRYHR